MKHRYFYVLRDLTEYENVLATFDTLEEVADYMGITVRAIHVKNELLHYFDQFPDFHAPADFYAVWDDKILYRYDVNLLRKV